MNFDNSFVVRDNECSALVCIMCNDIIPPKCESLYLLQAVEGLPSDRNRLTLLLYTTKPLTFRGAVEPQPMDLGYDSYLRCRVCGVGTDY